MKKKQKIRLKRERKMNNLCMVSVETKKENE